MEKAAQGYIASSVQLVDSCPWQQNYTQTGTTIPRFHEDRLWAVPCCDSKIRVLLLNFCLDIHVWRFLHSVRECMHVLDWLSYSLTGDDVRLPCKPMLFSTLLPGCYLLLAISVAGKNPGIARPTLTPAQTNRPTPTPGQRQPLTASGRTSTFFHFGLTTSAECSLRARQHDHAHGRPSSRPPRVPASCAVAKSWLCTLALDSLLYHISSATIPSYCFVVLVPG
ncbi:hypothetical protein P280DRAFT_275116 [Massarina eburnea CBS 473.64]|uniref:Uncharacterized protein n=1 Tax=Massarina eburnea CBS 473.64 TaxID=1395130 RepID=A0A6A6S5C7_9PLEO|nr:hypothetical protein P280DRAFT_275116 [Massarina eburnea CBS 473.64]